MGYTTLNKDEKEEEKKVLILFTPTFLHFGQEVSLAQRTRSIPIFLIQQIIICITKISTFLILCDLAVCLATLYVSFSLVFALMG